MTQVSPTQDSPEHQVAPDQLQSKFICDIAEEIVHRGFRVPALLVLEGGPLLTFLGSQLLWVSQPALSLFVPAYRIRRAATLLESPEAVKALTHQLQTMTEPKDS